MDTNHAATPHGVDVVIVGGGAAGLGAALQLARSRRSVVVVDAGEPRNAPASHMHAYLGHDGRPPGEFSAIARNEVTGYGATIIDGRVAEIAGSVDAGFAVRLEDGHIIASRRVVFAAGVVDELPDIPGVAEQWGRGVIHCPFCHGYEVRDRRLVLIASHPMAAHSAGLFRQLSKDLTVVLHDVSGVDATALDRLERHGVRIVDGPVAEVVSSDDTVTGVRLVDGSVIDADAVVVSTRVQARTGPLARLGVKTESNPMGTFVATDAVRQTSVAGVYAVGNVTDGSHQVLHAAADGTRTGAWINADLVTEDLEAHPAP